MHILWNLEKWYRRTRLLGRSRDTDAENGRVWIWWGKAGGTNGEIGIDLYTHYREWSGSEGNKGFT